MQTNKQYSFIKRYAQWSFHHSWVIILLSLVVLAISIYFSAKLKLKSDFKELLPDNYESVQELNRTAERVGGLSNLLIGVEAPDFKTGKSFVDALIPALQAGLPSEMVQSIDYNVADLKSFFETNKYLYVEVADLKEIYNRLKRSIDYEKLNSTGLLIDFEEETPEFNIKDIENKYKGEGSYHNYIDGYFTGEDGKLFAIMIRPQASSTSVDKARTLLANVNKIIEEVNPKKFSPQIRVGLAGKEKNFIREYEALIDDIVSTLALVIAGVALAVYLYYRKFRMVILMTIPVFVGTAWTFALTYFFIGYLTSQTAFLGSIIIGNGINYGLIFMARYLEEKRAGNDVSAALHISLQSTWLATLVASLTTTVGFGVLIITKVKGFSHFGYIGGIGMYLCWLATYLALPAYIAATERLWPIQMKAGDINRNPFLTKLLGRWATNHTSLILKLSLIITAVSLLFTLLYVPNSLEYDFTKLRFNPPETGGLWERKLHDRLTAIFPMSLSPAIILAKDPDQAQAVCKVILDKKEKMGVDLSKVDTCRTLYSYIPEQQNEKLKQLEEIRTLLSGSNYKFMDEEQKKSADEFLTTANLKIITLEDVPQKIKDRFIEKNGSMGNIIFVYSKKDADLWNGKNLIQFAGEIRKIQLTDGTIITGSGQSVIFSDLLSAVAKDGPVAVSISYVGILLVVYLLFRNRRESMLVTASLTLGILWQVMLLYFFDIKLNFLNFIALPTTYGIGVDYAVNYLQRYKLEGKGGVVKALIETGGAIILCSVTSLVGYSSLMISNSKALSTFGYLALLGEITCLLVALLVLPAYIIDRERKNQPVC